MQTKIIGIDKLKAVGTFKNGSDTYVVETYLGYDVSAGKLMIHSTVYKDGKGMSKDKQDADEFATNAVDTNTRNLEKLIQEAFKLELTV